MIIRTVLISIIFTILTIGTIGARESDAPIETRCGWFDNPTPANISLIDRDGEWIIGVQGGYQVDDNWPWPSFKKSQWVITNSGEHGHGCACLKVSTNKSTKRITHIFSASPRPLNACRKDHAIKEPA